MIKNLGELNSFVADSYYNLADIFLSQGNLIKAEKLYNKSLNLLILIFG